VGDLTVLPPPLFVRIVAALAPPAEGDEHAQLLSKHLSEHVGSYCRAHPEAIAAALLRSLTPASKMPSIAPSEAMFLLELSLAHAGAEDGCTSTLRARCAEACATAWRDFVTGAAGGAGSTSAPNPKRQRKATPPPPTTLEYNRLPADVKIELLEAALRRARTDVDEKVGKHDATVQDLRAQYWRAHDAKDAQHQQAMSAKIEQHQRELSAKSEQHQRELSAKQKELDQVQDQLGESQNEVRRLQGQMAAQNQQEQYPRIVDEHELAVSWRGRVMGASWAPGGGRYEFPL
jgi:hypothetical protein